MNRISTVLTAASGVACLAVVIVTVVGYRLDERSRGLLDEQKHGITVTPHFHIRFSAGGVWFYSEELPYRGSIIALGDSEGNLHYGDGRYARPIRDRVWHVGDYGVRLTALANQNGQIVRSESACDFPGIYYRRFQWIGERPDWTLMVNCLYPFLLFAVLPTMWISRWWRSQPKHSVQPTPVPGAAGGG